MRSIFSLLLMACLCISVSGCGGEAEKAGPEMSPPSNAGSDTSSDTKSEESAGSGEKAEESAE